MSDNNQELLAELRRIDEAATTLANPQYEDWQVTVVDGFDDSWGVTLEGPTSFYKILVNPDGSIKGALQGRTGQRGEPTNLGVDTLIRLLSGFE